MINKFINNNKKSFILFTILLLCFVILTIMVISGNTYQIDSLIHSFVIKMRNDGLTSLFNIITEFGGATFLLGFSLILLLFKKEKRMYMYSFINLVFAFIVNQGLKMVFMRERPIGINLIEETGFSYPSGHSMVSLAFYGFMIYLIFKNVNNKIARNLITTLLCFLVILIGFSRIYLGVHYFTDIIAGFLVAIMYLFIFIKIIYVEKK